MPTRMSKRRVLAGYKKHLRAIRNPVLKNQKQNQVYNDRRRRISTRYREKQITKAMADAGIDMTSIEKRQEQDIKSMKKFAREHKARVLKTARSLQTRQRGFRKDIPRRHEILKQFRGNPVSTGCLLRADSIDGIEIRAEITPGVDYDRSQPLIERTNLCDNAAEVDVAVYTSGTGSGFVWQFIDFHFVWMSVYQGILAPLAELHMNGGYQLEAPPACNKETRGSVSIESFFRVAQTDLNGAPQQTVSIPANVLLSKDFRGGGSNGYVYYDQLTPFYDRTNLVAPPMEIVSGYPVIFTVTFAIFTRAYNGGAAEVDLRTGPYEINVPGIAFTVES